MRPVLKIFFVVIVFLFLFQSDTPNLYAQTADGRRIAGKNRYETAAAISKEGWQRSYYAVVVSGQDFADALCSGPLANKFRAPVLLTEKKQLPEESLAELKRLGTKHVMIVGGPEAIELTLEEKLKQEGIEYFERIYGPNRFETSLKIAQKMNAESEAVLVSGQDPWDALSFSPVAAYRGIPILLTDRDHLPENVKPYLEQKHIVKTYVIGGSGAIAPGIEKELPGPVRIGGMDRYETNRLILTGFSEGFNFQKIYAVTAGNSLKCSFSDGLSICSLAAKGWLL
ncbi:MAG: cell wall-binding repeat-containing protein [Peptococcaceae bacterium]|nr:cell wall-binding repeat-containing protein [Peptococcaceae bacterium]